MLEVSEKQHLDFDADRVWELISDFGDMSWLPGVKSRVEGSGPGMLRWLLVPGAPDVPERLDSLDPATRTLTYTLLDNLPFPATDYRAQMCVTAAPDGGCELEWTIQVEPDGVPEPELRAPLEGLLRVFLDSIRSYLEAADAFLTYLASVSSPR